MKKQKPPVGRYFRQPGPPPGQIALIPLRRLAPFVERTVGGRRHELLERVKLQSVAFLQHFPIEVWPQFRFHEVRGCGHGLGPELADEPHHPRHRCGEPRHVAFVAVIPAEVQVTVGAVE